MTVNRVVRVIAGFFILFSLTMAAKSGQVALSNAPWLWFTAFVGANLLQSGFTNFCPMDIFLKKLGVREA